jgi:hypothetical protein
MITSLKSALFKYQQARGRPPIVIREDSFWSILLAMVNYP